MRTSQPSPGNGHGRNPPSTGTLPAISEDDGDFVPPPVPPVTQKPPGHNSTVHHWSTMNFVKAFERSANRSPPTYSFRSSSVEGEENEKVVTIRNKKQIAKRGGWKRLALLAMIIMMCIVGLVVGLVVGLRKRKMTSNSSSPSSSSNPASSINTTFPAGSYGIQTFLETVSTSCTSNSATWRCYPYATYSESPSASAARFDWFIQPESEGSNSYTATATNNPFSPGFTNITLKLVDAGLATERYTFQVAMDKPVIPTADVSGSNIQTTCYFNQTMFEAELYTKKEKNYPGSGANNSTMYVPWPYAVTIKQLASAGSNVPDCIDVNGAQVSGKFSVTGSENECSCIYQNYGQ